MNNLRELAFTEEFLDALSERSIDTRAGGLKAIWNERIDRADSDKVLSDTEGNESWIKQNSGITYIPDP